MADKHPKNYDATLARMVGNLLSGQPWPLTFDEMKHNQLAVSERQKFLVKQAIAVSEYALDRLAGSANERRG